MHLVEVDWNRDDGVSDLLVGVVFGDLLGIGKDHADELLDGELGLLVMLEDDGASFRMSLNVVVWESLLLSKF